MVKVNRGGLFGVFDLVFISRVYTGYYGIWNIGHV